MDILHEIFPFLEPRELRLVNREFNSIVSDSREFFHRDYGRHESFNDWLHFPKNRLLGICQHFLPELVEDLEKAYLLSCEHNCVIMARYLAIKLRSGPDHPPYPSLVISHGIQIAIRCRHYYLTYRLLEIFPDANLAWALQTNDKSMIRLLLHFVKPAPSSLAFAIEYKLPDVVDILLSCPEVKINGDAIRLAIHAKWPEIIPKILNHPRFVFLHCESVLYMAILHRDIELLKQLLIMSQD